MYFHPNSISEEAIDALHNVGLTFDGQEMFVDNNEWPSEEWEASNHSILTLRGVTIGKTQIQFTGHRDAPKVYSTLEDDMVPTGVDLSQCSVCGYWMSRKDSPSDERQHIRSCEPQYQWEAVGLSQSVA